MQHFTVQFYLAIELPVAAIAAASLTEDRDNGANSLQIRNRSSSVAACLWRSIGNSRAFGMVVGDRLDPSRDVDCRLPVVWHVYQACHGHRRFAAA